MKLLNGIIISDRLKETVNKLTESSLDGREQGMIYTYPVFVQNRYNRGKYDNFIIKYGKILKEKIADVIILYKKTLPVMEVEWYIIIEIEVMYEKEMTVSGQEGEESIYGR